MSQSKNTKRPLLEKLDRIPQTYAVLIGLQLGYTTEPVLVEKKSEDLPNEVLE